MSASENRWRDRARLAEDRLAALDRALAAVAAELDIERVLQLIVDEVRRLVHARYAALGLVGRDGTIETFITSGLSAGARKRIGPLPTGRGLLGALIHEGRSIRLDDASADPRSVGVPDHHFAVRAFLGVPVRVRGRPVGNLYLVNKRGGPFTAADQDLVERFALHAGIGIDNARLHEQARRLAIVEERDRIGRELHDSVVQRLYGVTLSLEDVPDLVPGEPDDARRRVDLAIDAIQEAIGEMRSFIYGLRPTLLGPADLRQSLQHLADEAERRGPSVIVTVPEVALDADVAAELVAITREALSNVARHAHASRAEVRLVEDDARLRLMISDDGRGFDAGGQRRSAQRGLSNIRDRATALGGRLVVRSRPGAGTRVTVDLPRSTDQGESSFG